MICVFLCLTYFTQCDKFLFEKPILNPKTILFLPTKKMNSYLCSPKWIWLLEKSSESSGGRTVKKSADQTRGDPGTADQGPREPKERLSCGPGRTLMGSMQKKHPADISAAVSLGNHFKGKASISMCVLSGTFCKHQAQDLHY